MNICCSRLGGLIFCMVTCLLTTVSCQEQPWTGYHYQYHPTTTLFPGTDQQAAITQDLLLQDSIRKQSFISPMPWKDARSKPQWQTLMYKPKWQDPHSKPQWQVPKAAYTPKAFSKPLKNTVDGNEWRKQWRPVKFNPMPFRRKVTPSPRMNSQSSWPEYIPPLSVIKPSMDDPHALLNWRR